MPRITITLAALLVGIPSLWGDDQSKEQPAPAKAQTPAEQFHALAKEYNQAQEKFFKAIREAKTDAERSKVTRPPTDKYVEQILELAEKNPKEPFAPEALVWVVQRSFGPPADKALGILARDYDPKDDKVAAVAAMLRYSSSPSAEKLLRNIVEKNANHKLQGQACLVLASYLKRKSEAAGSPDTSEAEKYFNQTIENYSDVEGLAQEAKDGLFEITHFGIGKAAPEIEGEDIDGKKFKLSDYRGKVVLLDFWGNW